MVLSTDTEVLKADCNYNFIWKKVITEAKQSQLINWKAIQLNEMFKYGMHSDEKYSALILTVNTRTVHTNVMPDHWMTSLIHLKARIDKRQTRMEMLCDNQLMVNKRK